MPRVLPGSKNAKRAAVFCVLAIVYGILMPAIPLSIIDVIGGLAVVSIVSIELILAIFALIFSYIAIFKEKERSIITLIFFGFFCLVAGFWLLFFLGNIFIHP